MFWPEGSGVENVVIEYGGPEAVRRGIWHVNDPGGMFTIDGTVIKPGDAAAEGRRVDLRTTCERAVPLPTGLAANTFDD